MSEIKEAGTDNIAQDLNTSTLSIPPKIGVEEEDKECNESPEPVNTENRKRDSYLVPENQKMSADAIDISPDPEKALFTSQGSATFPDQTAAPDREASMNAMEDRAEKALFSPPLSVQRYEFVCNLVKKLQCESIVDLGCGECRLIQKIKRLDLVKRIVGVDIDASVLRGSKFKCRPLITDHICPRLLPLTVELYQGDVTKFDSRIEHVDFAALVEVVEHLPSDLLAALPNTLFGELAPKYVVITTPNSEYNVLFENFQGFRHWDHKFEWSREEFKVWCNSITESYDYHVAFGGVGDPPNDSDVGFCTQIAFFSRKGDVEMTKEATECYEEICIEKHPFKTERMKLIDKISLEVESAIPELAEKDAVTNVNVMDLFSLTSIRNMCKEDEFRELLLSAHYNLSSDENYLVVDLRADKWHCSSDSDSGGQFDDADDDYSAELFLQPHNVVLERDALWS